MSETDHVHERGEFLGHANAVNDDYFRCQHCSWQVGRVQWRTWETAIAAVQAHGLPDHPERLEAAIAAGASAKRGGHSMTQVIERAFRAYLAWTKEEAA